MPGMQCGAVCHRGTDFAHHLVQTVMLYAKMASLSVFALFLDLVKAFDRIIRELVLGWPDNCDEDHVTYLLGLGISRHAAEFIADYIDTHGC
eukprot:12424279-Karenia_brevis.AAC.1